jgi:hypothetical protein
VPPKTVIYRNAEYYVAKRQGKIFGGNLDSSEGVTTLGPGEELNCEDFKHHPLFPDVDCILH